MSVGIDVKWDRSGMAGLEESPLKGALKRALNKAGRDAQRAMRAEASRRIRVRKRIKGRYITRAMTLRRSKARDIADMEWALEFDGDPVPLVAYPHRQTQKGVSVEVNKGKRTVIAGSFIASMKSGHVGVFKRKGAARLPIQELRGSRPLDAMLHKGEADAVAQRGGSVFSATFVRVLPLEIEK